MTTQENMRLEERMISAMRQRGLLVTEAIEEQVYVERFNCRIDESSNPSEVFDRCKKEVGGEVDAQCVPIPGEIL